MEKTGATHGSAHDLSRERQHPYMAATISTPGESRPAIITWESPILTEVRLELLRQGEELKRQGEVLSSYTRKAEALSLSQYASDLVEEEIPPGARDAMTGTKTLQKYAAGQVNGHLAQRLKDAGWGVEIAKEFVDLNAYRNKVAHPAAIEPSALYDLKYPNLRLLLEDKYRKQYRK